MVAISWLIEAKPANETTYVKTWNDTVVIPSHNEHMQWLITEFQKLHDHIEDDCLNWCLEKERNPDASRSKKKFKNERYDGVSELACDPAPFNSFNSLCS